MCIKQPCVTSERCVVIGNYIVETGSTVRAAAKHFGYCKSTIHNEVTKVLKKTNKAVYNNVQRVLQKNKEERHLRGGEATKQLYLQKREEQLKM